jgi:predicted transcriptional regulator
MRQKDNYFGEIERLAGDILKPAGYEGSGALSQGTLNSIIRRLGFEICPVPDVPAAVRSVTDLRSKRIYIPSGSALPSQYARSVILETIGHVVLGHTGPANFGELLRQQVEANYFVGALLMPEMAAVPILQRVKQARDISVEDLRDIFYVSYEQAAHRLTNLATKHLGIRTHFIRSDREGLIGKAYENDDVPLPMDVDEVIEGNQICSKWGTRKVFADPNSYGIHYQLTDTPAGTFWCATHIDAERDTAHAITVGARFNDAIYFRGRDTKHRAASRCPSPDCCQVPPERLARKWDGYAWPSVRARGQILAALPAGKFPGAGLVEIYEFLDRHASEDTPTEPE